MESNNISSEIAEHGDNSPGCSLKGEMRCIVCGVPKSEHHVWMDSGPRSWTHDFQAPNIRQYMTAIIPCERNVNKSKPFPSILESAEQERRVERNRESNLEFVRQSICGLIEA